jgi:tetratricopeptide (TPR) repeat protein
MYDSAVTTAIDEVTTTLNGVPAVEIKSELDRILRSRAFIQSHRIRRFLQFVVEESLLGQPHRLKEYLIGLEVFDRREAFDPRVDSIVRVEARRLRNKLEEYYRTEGQEDPVRVLLRKGSYVPIFEYRHASATSAAPSQRRVVEIAPFALMQPPAGAEAIADEIQRRLSHVLIKEGCFQVITNSRPNTSDPIGEETHSNGTNGNGHSVPTSAPDYAVEGSIEFQPGGFHLILQLIQSPDHSYVWSEAADYKLDDLAPVEQLAQLLLRELAAFPNEALARRQASHQDGRDAYLQGRYYWKLATPDTIRNSVSCFTRAVESDVNYAAAWAALAEALTVSSMFGFLAPNETGGRMKEAALKALSLNTILPETHIALGSVLSILDWDWEAGERELQKSIQLDSHDPIGHIAYGVQLACRGMFDPAVVEVERALEMDPAALFPNFVLGWLYGVCRRLDEAISQHLLVSKLAPDYALPHFGLGLAYAGKGMFQDAIAHFTNATQLKCRSLLGGQLGYCYAMANRREEALREIANLNLRSESYYVSPVSFASIYCGLQDKEKAQNYLEQALEAHDPSLPIQLLNPEFDSLRNEARFQALRRRIGLLAT